MARAGDERCAAGHDPGCKSMPEGATQLGEQARRSYSDRLMIPSLASLSGAFSLELQHALERRHFAVGCTELLGQLEKLTLGGEQPFRHEASRFDKIVVSEGGGCHERLHRDCR